MEERDGRGCQAPNAMEALQPVLHRVAGRYFAAACPARVRSITVMADATTPATSEMLLGMIERVADLRKVGEGFDVLLRHLRFAASIPPGKPIAGRDHAHRVRVRVGDQLDRARLALRLVDLRLLLALGLEDRRLALAVGDVDLLLALALGGRDHRALLALGGDLRLHRAQDRFGRREALDLVAQHLDAPRAAGFVQHRHDLVVDLVAALEASCRAPSCRSRCAAPSARAA